VPVGVEGWAEVALGPLRAELPAEAFAVAEVRWRRRPGGSERAELRLSGAPLAATLEALADEEAAHLHALEPEASVSIERTRWLGVEARLVASDERQVLLAMRNPWRVARLFVRGGELRAMLGPGSVHVAGVRLSPRGWSVESARFEAPTYVVRCTRTCCRVDARNAADPARVEGVRARIEESLRERRSGARPAHPDSEACRPRCRR